MYHGNSQPSSKWRKDKCIMVMVGHLQKGGRLGYHGNSQPFSKRRNFLPSSFTDVNVKFIYFRIVTTGFHTLIHDDEEEDNDVVTSANSVDVMRQSSQSGELNPRISISPALLIDMLSCLYYIM